MTTLEQAEAELVARWQAGDQNTTELEQLIERIDQEANARRAAVTLHSAALWYASIGLKVFPLSPGTKIPFKGSSGCLDASSNADVINGWWEHSPDANIGVATGHLVDVVDIDGLPGQTARAKHWCAEACGAETCGHAGFGQIDRISIAKVMTPRPGGMHLYVPASGDGNKAGIAPGIDYRGKGGYVVAPPSVIAEGHGTPGRYSFLGTPSLGQLQP